MRVLHRNCGGHLFDYDVAPVVGEPVWAKHVTLLDGTRPTLDTPISVKCPKCGQIVNHMGEFEPEGWT